MEIHIVFDTGIACDISTRQIIDHDGGAIRSDDALPDDKSAALTEGDYKTRIFLTRGGDVISKYETSIFVRKVGMERWLFRMSRESAFLYGLMSLAIAIAAGWGASAVFSAFRR